MTKSLLVKSGAIDTVPPGKLYGRRRARPLRPGQRRLREELLPQLTIKSPNGPRLDFRAVFPMPIDAVWLEIGFGAGEHLAEQAEHHSSIGFVGCEVFEDGIVRLLGEIERRDLGNVRLFTDDARLLLGALPPASLGRVFILFPDPWPKRRHHKRRLVAPATLDLLSEAMTDGAELRLATDDRDYLAWMLEHIVAHPDFVWLARRPADWRERGENWPGTRYEAKARAAGREPVFLRFIRRPRG
ncbi:MAG: tRNA (guanosine(46)-N7)-methyltransferase TrmB [Alphaproteobacteria bacterium]|nr:tRNA (guanosine(46)-N7)-methyltransferase TrmB [Alphaproteobacteria bacterium]